MSQPFLKFQNCVQYFWYLKLGRKHVQRCFALSYISFDSLQSRLHLGTVEIKVMFCTQISSRSFSLMYSARVLVLPPRHDNLWRSVNIDIQLAGLWHEREPCLHFNPLWSDYALTLGQLSTVPKKRFCIWLDHNWSSSFFPNSCFQRSHRYSVEESEGRNDLAVDTNDAVDDIVDGLITFGPNFWTDNPRSDIFRPQSTDKSGL